MGKPKTLDEVFDAIAQEAILAASRVECSKEAFCEGLKDIEVTVRERREMMEEEIEHDLRAAEKADD